ncbi:MAG: hypothetical protein GXO87_12785 [Chlorobi bacterium]|nr:hypothetical protein [Chlorobiota bacterium]
MKIFRLKRLAFFFLATALFWSCAGKKEVQKEAEDKYVEVKEAIQEMNVEVDSIYAWVNLMPGGPKKFNITGKVIVLPSGDYDANKLTLKRIDIFQRDVLHYMIKPTVQNPDKENNDGKVFLFSTIRGVGLNPGFNYDKKIDALFIFEQNGETFRYLVKDLKMEKAY